MKNGNLVLQGLLTTKIQTLDSNQLSWFFKRNEGSDVGINIREMSLAQHDIGYKPNPERRRPITKLIFKTFIGIFYCFINIEILVQNSMDVLSLWTQPVQEPYSHTPPYESQMYQKAIILVLDSQNFNKQLMGI